MPRGISVEFHPEKFEDAINRHGQYVRWYASLPCYCIDEMVRADPACPVCRGRGFIYTPIKEKRRIDKGLSFGGTTIAVADGVVIKSIYKVQRPSGEAISYSSFSGNQITLSSSLNKGAYYEVDYVEDLEVAFIGEAVWEGNGIVKASITPEQTAEGNFIGTLSEVTYLKNITQDKELNVLEYWEDRMLTDHTPDSGDVLEVSCKYLKPVKFLIVSVKGKEERVMASRSRVIRDERIAAFQDFDATLTFPGFVTVGAGDLITLLKAEQKTSIVGNAPTNVYRLPFFHVNRLVAIQDAVGDIDLSTVSIIRKNELQFNGRKPDGNFALAFMYLPTFIVSGETPSLRYGEDKVFPKVVGLKRFDEMGQRDARPNINHSLFETGGI